MSQRSSAAARAFAAFAVACGFIVLIVVISSSLDEGESNSGGGGRELTRQAKPSGKQARKAYVVQNGDTLTSIARRMGVSVARLQALNPGVDPQILVSGEKLKLR